MIYCKEYKTMHLHLSALGSLLFKSRQERCYIWIILMNTQYFTYVMTLLIYSLQAISCFNSKLRQICRTLNYALAFNFIQSKDNRLTTSMNRYWFKVSAVFTTSILLQNHSVHRNRFSPNIPLMVLWLVYSYREIIHYVRLEIF